MSGKEVTLSGEVRIRDGFCSTTMNAMEALKVIGIAYGVYSCAEEARDCRVMLLEGDHPVLVIQEDISHHGSPQWETVRTMTNDPKQIQQYMAFRDMMAMFREMDREPVLPQKTAERKKGVGKGHER
ncbi:MAG: hypothetical protein HDT33_11565 [Clostridiales bacterium]|nr:hypothetical protein [Clostridiales bacterium]